jgi:Zn-dependent peptidase ImmA (M78 family)
MKRRAEQKACDLLAQFGPVSPPIDLDAILKQHDIALVMEEMPDEVSGALYAAPNQRPIIIVNKMQSMVRKRFTIAHELGHYFLGQSNEVHVDTQIMFRSQQSSGANESAEIAANTFAAELLMPEQMVRQEYTKRWKNVFEDDDELVGELAKLFKVSTIAMGFRLKKLGLILP